MLSVYLPLVLWDNSTVSSNALGSLGSLTLHGLVSVNIIPLFIGSESSDQPYFYKLYSIQKEGHCNPAHKRFSASAVDYSEPFFEQKHCWPEHSEVRTKEYIK